MYNRNLSQPASFTTILIIHVALLIGQVLFAAVCLSITPTKGFSFNISDTFTLVATVLAAGGFTVSTFLYRAQLNVALGKDTAQGKLTYYLNAIIMRAAPLEGASLFCIVAYMLNGNLFFIIIAGIIILYFAMVIPTKDRVLSTLNLSAADLTNEPQY